MPASPIRPAPDVLVAVEPRAELGARVVEVDHDQPIEADPRVELGEEGVDGRRVADVDPGAPGVGGVEAEADALLRRRREAAIGRGDGGELARRSCPGPNPPPGGVLEDESMAAGSALVVGELGRLVARRFSAAHRSPSANARATPSARRSMPASTPVAPMRPDVDVDEAAAEVRARRAARGRAARPSARRTSAPGRPG